MSKLSPPRPAMTFGKRPLNRRLSPNRPESQNKGLNAQRRTAQQGHQDREDPNLSTSLNKRTKCTGEEVDVKYVLVAQPRGFSHQEVL